MAALRVIGFVAGERTAEDVRVAGHATGAELGEQQPPWRSLG
jgi:hypothetical protein